MSDLPPNPHGPDEECTCTPEPALVEALLSELVDALGAELAVVAGGPATSGSACIASNRDPLTTARILRAIANDVERQGAMLS